MTSQDWCGRIGTEPSFPVSTCCPRVGRGGDGSCHPGRPQVQRQQTIITGDGAEARPIKEEKGMRADTGCLSGPGHLPFLASGTELCRSSERKGGSEAVSSD